MASRIAQEVAIKLAQAVIFCTTSQAHGIHSSIVALNLCGDVSEVPLLGSRGARISSTVGAFVYQKLAMAETVGAQQASPEALETIAKYFDVALVQDAYFESAKDTLQELGFARDTTIALVNTCRDEIARPISHFFDKNYGHTFNLSGIAGVITAGTLGFVAGTAHAPSNPDGRNKYVFIGATHAAVDQNGVEGPVVREGQTKVSNACGAIEAILGEIRSGAKQDGVIREDNIEYDTLKKKVFAKKPSDHATNFELTKLTAEAITDTIEDHIGKTVDPAKSDYAVIVGAQIHAGVKHGLWTPDTVLDYFAPVTAYVVLKGEKQELKVHGDKIVVA